MKFGKKQKDEHDQIYGKAFAGECICCHNKHSVEKGDDCYFCHNCRMIFPAETYERWMNGESITFDYVNGDYFCDPSYDSVYDEEENEVLTECCGVPMKWLDDHYVCPECGETIARQDFFEIIGANIPGDLCLTCDQLYPCTSCHLGYEIEDEF